jgi:hypothetical protein
MKRKHFLVIALVCVTGWFTACQETDSELADIVLYNPFETGNGVELMQVDSVQKFGGSNPYLKAYFSINYEYFDDTAAIDRVVLYRDDAEKAILSPGNQSFFIDMSVVTGETYFYQLSLIMDDGSKTKRTMPFEVLF